MIAEPSVTAIVEWAEKFNMAPYIGDYVTITIKALPDGTREFELE